MAITCYLLRASSLYFVVDKYSVHLVIGFGSPVKTQLLIGPPRHRTRVKAEISDLSETLVSVSLPA